MTDAAQDAPQPEDPVAAYARTHLGPASEAYVRRPEVRGAVDERLAADQPLEDAVLGAVHGGIGKSRRLADEFANYFLADLMQMGKLSMSASSRLRRFLDTGDLVLSVFGDLWGDLADLEFTSRASFRALFAQRMQWKAADRSRQLTTKRRAEDKRVAKAVEDIELADEGAESEARALLREDAEELALIMSRLSERDQRILRLLLQGVALGDIAERLGIQYHAARVAAARAVAHARKIREARDKRH